MFLVVGLGNPGREYENTPHNIGFKVVDALASRWGVVFKKGFEGLYTPPHQSCVLLKPQTYMNLSGRSVRPALDFFKGQAESCLVISDDIDLPKGALRLRLNGGAGGHNGLKSVIETLGQNFPRLRMGVGRDGDAAGHVLGKVSKADAKIYEEMVIDAITAVELILKDGVGLAMNTVNRKKESDVT